MITVICSQKGGTGKSTLATNLCVFLAKEGRDIVLVDGDRQETASNWVSDRDDNPELMKVHSVQKYDNIKSTIQDLSSRYEYVIVDVAGHDSKEMRTALLAADIALVPTQCSQPDLGTLHKLEKIIDQAKEFNEKLQVFTLFSRTPTNPCIKEIKEAREYMDDLNLQVLNTCISERKVYRDAIKQGKGVLELGNSKAINEIKSLVEEIKL